MVLGDGVKSDERLSESIFKHALVFSKKDIKNVNFFLMFFSFLDFFGFNDILK